jgi:hypothetical protein
VRGKQGIKHLDLTLASVYHPCTKTGVNKTYLHFLDTLDTRLNHLPVKSELIMGADINANIDKLDNLHSANFRAALGPHGLPKRNPKGTSLLTAYLTHHLHVMNMFFETKTNSTDHSTWTNNHPTTTGIADLHMLNIIVCSGTLHKRIQNCCTTLDGMDSNHQAVCMDLNLTSIKYKAKTSMNCRDIDWRKICEEDKQCKLYNKYLIKLTSCDMLSDNFCKAVVRAGREPAIAIDDKCEDWYAASKKIQAPAIKKKNQLRYPLHDRSNLSPDKIVHLKSRLKAINKCNQGLVKLAKTSWYKEICGKIHNMRMNPRLAWKNIRILTGGETTHHETNLNMSMRLENGKLASNAKENLSVFDMNFHKVLNNHRPVDSMVLDLIK